MCDIKVADVGFGIHFYSTFFIEFDGGVVPVGDQPAYAFAVFFFCNVDDCIQELCADALSACGLFYDQVVEVERFTDPGIEGEEVGRYADDLLLFIFGNKTAEVIFFVDHLFQGHHYFFGHLLVDREFFYKRENGGEV